MERGDVATLSPSNSAAKFFTLQRIWTSWALQISTDLSKESISAAMSGRQQEPERKAQAPFCEWGRTLFWCAPRQVDSEKNIKFFGCPVFAGQLFYAAFSCS